MSHDPSVDLEIAEFAQRLQDEGLPTALENLRYKSGSIFDHEPPRSPGLPPGFIDEAFRLANPEHPSSAPQRFIRMHGADFINRLAGTNPQAVTDSILQELHTSLFDRSPAVRLAIAQALGKLGRPESAVHLKHLLEAEDESDWVRKAAEESLTLCDQSSIHQLAIFCADIGSEARNRFAWASAYAGAAVPASPNDSSIRALADAVADYLARGVPVALGFECPLFVPITEDPTLLTAGRTNEGSRAWSAGAGAGALATGLTQVVWVLRAVREHLVTPPEVYTEWSEFQSADKGLFLWEAFVSGKGKGSLSTHVGDAEIAVNLFLNSLPDPTVNNAIPSETVHSLIGAALLRTGWTTDLSVLAKPCLVLKA